MRILYLCQLVPYPPDAGPKVRAYYTLRYLAKQHQVTLLAFSRPDDQPEALEHLRSFLDAVEVVPIRRSRLKDGRSLLTSLATGRSFVIGRDYLPAMAARVDALLSSGGFDAVHSDQLWMAQYALRAKRLDASSLKVQTVLDEHNACFQIVQRLAEGEPNPVKRMVMELEWRALRKFESRVLGEFDRVATVTEEDRQTLENLRSETSEIAVNLPDLIKIPICVDTVEIQPVQASPGARDVLHLGTMFWPPNVEGVLWFARQVWPKIQAALPEATFTIAGKNPPAEVQALGAINSQQSTDINLQSAIRVTGYVPDPLPYLEAAGAFIVPLFSGSGMRVKIVDAWRWGLPVISTTIGAEGIERRDGENILIADDPQAFAEAVTRVLSDADLNRALRLNGRRWVEQKYDWQRVHPEWDTIYPG